MIEFLEDALSSPGFYILGGGAVVATVIGWTMSRSFGASLPLWQLLVIVVVELIVAALFGRE